MCLIGNSDRNVRERCLSGGCWGLYASRKYPQKREKEKECWGYTDDMERKYVTDECEMQRERKI
jgi:hypothetical protein